LINAAAYNVVRFSPDINKDGGYLLLQCTVQQCVNRGIIWTLLVATECSDCGQGSQV